MKHIPILFSTEMVESILLGTKTMTRRTKGLEKFNNPEDRPHDELWEENPGRWFYAGMKDGVLHMECMDTFESFETKIPYNVGDILWVRETFRLTQPYDPETYHFGYKNGFNSDDPASEKYDFSEPDQWRPSIHMPKEACRIFLKVTDVRIERLQDITEQDAISEGIISDIEPILHYKHYLKDDHWYQNPIRSFESLWSKINGQPSWDANPFVWVITFERCPRPLNFLNSPLKS